MDGRCNETRYSYDDRGLLERTEWPDVDGSGAVETRAYSDAGHLELIVDADGVIVTFEHDAVGRVIEEAVGDSVTRTEWDALGRVSRVVGPRHQGPSAPDREFAYDGFGRLAEVTDEAGNQTRYWYDEADRMVRTEEHAAVPSGAGDAAAGAPVSPLVTRREYTPLGYLRVHRQVGASGPTIATTFSDHTPTGLPQRIEDARGQVQVLEYDALGRRTSLTLEGQAADLPWQLSSVTWEYNDATGDLVVTEQKVGAAEGSFEDTRLVERDALDRVSRITETRGAEGGVLEQHFAYDLDGRRTSLRTLLDNDPPEETRWSWDARGRLETLEVVPAGDFPEVTQYTHSPAGRPQTVDYPNATRAVYAWDFDNDAQGARGLLTGITHSELVPEGPDIPLAAVTYAYDPAGNRERQTLTLDGASETTHYGYDVIDQLARVTVVPASGPTRHVSYTHVGHERVRELHLENCTPDDDDRSICMNGVVSERHFRWNDLRQLESVHEEYPGAAGLVQAWEYDAAGNLAERRRYDRDEEDQPVLAQRDEFRWDGLGRMVESARGPPGTPQILGQYDYDAQGLRIRVRGTTRNADAWYDGLNLLVERTPVSEGATPLMRHHYDPMGLHAQRARHDGPTSLPTTHYAHRDALGSTLLMSRPATSSDTIAASYRTDPWGRITHESGGAHLNPTVFTGHQHDTETGLIYMRARYYDPTIGRFLSQDPWLGDESNPASLNRYLYAYGNPGVWVDPDGRMPWHAYDIVEGGRACEGIPPGEDGGNEEYRTCMRDRRVSGIHAERREQTGLSGEVQRLRHRQMLYRMVEADTVDERAALASSLAESAVFIPHELLAELQEGGVRIAALSHRPGRIEALGPCDTRSQQNRGECRARAVFGETQSRVQNESDLGGTYLELTQHVFIDERFESTSFVVVHELMHPLDQLLGAGLDQRKASDEQRPIRRAIRRTDRAGDGSWWSNQLPWNSHIAASLHDIGDCVVERGCPEGHYRATRQEYFAELGTAIAMRESERTQEILVEGARVMGGRWPLETAMRLGGAMGMSPVRMESERLLPRFQGSQWYYRLQGARFGEGGQ